MTKVAMASLVVAARAPPHVMSTLPWMRARAVVATTGLRVTVLVSRAPVACPAATPQ